MKSADIRAAELGLIKNMLGILCHPDRGKVIPRDADLDQVRASINFLREEAGLDWRDLMAYARAGVRDICITDKGSGPKFCYKRDA